jgi:uncharacterized protein YcbK (DUF882 family)
MMTAEQRRYVGMSNYSITEGSCSCGCGSRMQDDIVLALQAFVTILHRTYGAPIRHLITSGARCKQHNAEVGGSPTSQHLEGKACDGVFQQKLENHWLPLDILDVGQLARKSGLFGGIGYLEYLRHGKHFIHLDVRGGSTIVW